MSKETVRLNGCDVHWGRGELELEVLVKDSTKVMTGRYIYVYIQCNIYLPYIYGAAK